MNWKNWTPVIAAIVLGAVAAKIARDSLTGVKKTAEVRVLKVVMAKTPLQPGQELTADHLAMGNVAGTVAPPNTFTDMSAVVGRVATAPMFPGQPIFEGSLAPKGASTGLAALIPPGMRAITIDVNETSSLAGMLVPGCRVDAMSVISNGENLNTASRLIAQNILVQAVGQKLASGRPAEDTEVKKPEAREIYRSVTLIVTPHEAQALQLASANTRMTLVLRGPGDTAANDEGPVSISDLIGSSIQTTESVRILQGPVPQTQPAPEATENPVAAAPSVAVAAPDAAVATIETPKRTVELIRGTNTPTRVEFRLHTALPALPPAPTLEAGGADMLRPLAPSEAEPRQE